MNLNTTNWKEFVLGRLFVIKKGKRLTSAEQEDGGNNYIGAIDSNNGIANHIAQAPIHKGNTISLSYNGSVGEAFYQKDPYWATDDVNVLYSKYEGFNEQIGLFIATVLKQEKYKFSYGRKWTLDNMNITIIKLPAQRNDDGTIYLDTSKKYSDDGYVPDWQWMENYIKSLHHKPLATRNKGTNVPQLNISSWKEFALKMLFNVELSKGDIKLDDVDRGTIPLVSSGESNNGIVGNIDEKGDGKAEIFKGNKITIDMFGNPFYQENDFYAVSHGRVNILEPKFELNKPIGLFIASIIKKEQYKFSYGRAVYSEEASNMIIELPVQHNNDGTPCQDVNRTYSDDGYIPDWVWMQNYIKSLPYGDRL